MGNGKDQGNADEFLQRKGHALCVHQEATLHAKLPLYANCWLQEQHAAALLRHDIMLIHGHCISSLA